MLFSHGRLQHLVSEQQAALHRAHAELKHLQGSLQGLSIALDKPLVVIGVEDQLVSCNGPALDLCGMRPDVLLDQPIAALLTGLPDRPDRGVLTPTSSACTVQPTHCASPFQATVVDLPDARRILLIDSPPSSVL